MQSIESPGFNYYYDYNYNYTDDNGTFDLHCEYSSLQGSNIFMPLIYYLIFFTGFWGNIFVVTVVGQKGKRGGRLVDTFVMNLALADLVFVLTLPLWAISASQNDCWDFGSASKLLCKLSSYIISVNRFSNIFFLTCMSIDRYLAIVRMMDSMYLRSTRCIHITCIVLWVVSFLLGIPSLVYRNLVPYEGGQACKEDESSMLFPNLAMVFLTFVFPLLIIVLCYGTIITHLNRHRIAAGNARAKARRRHSLKMVLCIIVAFGVSWLPYNTFKTIRIICFLSDTNLSCGTQVWLSNGFLISCCLAFFNSCVNPAIYFFLDHHFRRRAQFLFMSCIGKVKFSQSFNSSASYTNPGTSESFATSGGRTPLQMSLKDNR